MGKSRRLNKLISKWIKSDLPEDRSPVILLGVTRLSPASSPLRTRRPFSLPLALGAVSNCSKNSQVRRNSSVSSDNSRRRPYVSKRRANNNGDCRPRSAPHQIVPVETPEPSPEIRPSAAAKNVIGTPLNVAATFPVPAMDTSVDSIGACSLDMEASVEMSDWSEVSSDGTLRSASIVTPIDRHHHHHLPSYLSLACTVNGYSTTTNYDPIRLARSRDASPHRPETDHQSLVNQHPYSAKQNLLSPPNVVPLPDQNGTAMTDNLLDRHRHEEFYRSTTKTTFLAQESSFTPDIFAKDSVDSCAELKSQSIQSKCVTFESNAVTALESTVRKEFSNGTETKSSIQQRVERLYGPGALAQCFVSPRPKKHHNHESEYRETEDRHSKSLDEVGDAKNGCYFLKIMDEQTSIQKRVERLYGPGALAQCFVSPRPKKHHSHESEDREAEDRHSKSLTDKLLDDIGRETSMKQSSSSPSLPVLRHLRPEFRAQLPIISGRKSTQTSMQKSLTVPKLHSEGANVNGHSNINEEQRHVSDVTTAVKENGCSKQSLNEVGENKNGYYFLRILDEQTSRLSELADKVESELTNAELSEEVVGKLRSASGKARLLVSQKMQQFRGLCTNNINQSPGDAFPTTNEDLQGFWDMVMLQVDQVDKLFDEIEALKANNWKEVPSKKGPTKVNGASKASRKGVSKPKATSTVTDEARKQREEQRKRLIEERRKAMKAQRTNRSNIEIFVQESS
ncbi:uncharacterized protein LOC132699207 isoform X2 [Cylas formicarius]|uniref:uncharacterized protein LOC132699207 isoform X2 n=1 Tax=Cylas formicarius TaxID=197179 RepID=UPI002958536E|nr:uncharacterized protein LOC132699207 isoform X2 [Cylas formicarius]